MVDFNDHFLQNVFVEKMQMSTWPHGHMATYTYITIRFCRQMQKTNFDYMPGILVELVGYDKIYMFPFEEFFYLNDMFRSFV